MAIWLYGFMVLWLYGYMALWLYGYMALAFIMRLIILNYPINSLINESFGTSSTETGQAEERSSLNSWRTLSAASEMGKNSLQEAS